MAGAHENITPVVHRIPPFQRRLAQALGRTATAGPKWVIGTRWLQPLVLPLRGFPRVLPVQVAAARRRPCSSGCPFEITVETGPAHRPRHVGATGGGASNG